MFTVAIPDKGYDPLVHLGSLQLLSPLEELIVTLDCWAERLNAADGGDDELAFMKQEARNVKLCFRMVLDVRSESFSFCEDRWPSAKATLFSCRRRAGFIIGERALLQHAIDQGGERRKLKNDELAKHRSRIRVANGQDPLNLQNVALAIKMHDSFFAPIAVSAAYDKLELRTSHSLPFISHHQSIMAKAKTEDDLIWFLEQLDYMLEVDEICSVTSRDLGGPFGPDDHDEESLQGLCIGQIGSQAWLP